MHAKEQPPGSQREEMMGHSRKQRQIHIAHRQSVSPGRLTCRQIPSPSLAMVVCLIHTRGSTPYISKVGDAPPASILVPY
jgi:hypothetical protein